MSQSVAERLEPTPRTHVDALPVELLSRVFASLSSDRCHTEITSCRLVSRQWRALSSPFVITTVVIADRIDAIRKVREVVEHPYFSRHVTHLLWDSSVYQSDVAFSFRLYEDEFMKYRRPQGDRRHRGTREADNANVRSLLQGIPDQSVLAQQRDHTTPFPDDSFERGSKSQRKLAPPILAKRAILDNTGSSKEIHLDHHLAYWPRLQLGL